MYLAHKTYSTQAKNALDEAFENYLNDVDRTLIENDQINQYMNKIHEKYSELAKVHKRCKMRELSFYKYENQIHLHGSHVSFTFLKSK